MKIFPFVALLSALAVNGAVWADTHVEMVWDCKMREGKTFDEVEALNEDWMKFVNKKVKGGGVSSRIITPVVGDLGHFYFVDAFPNMTAWAQVYDAMQTPDGQKLEAQFDALSDCSSNRLYESRG